MKRGCFKYAADRIPVMLFIGMFALDLTVFFVVSERWFVAAWMVAGIFPKACICSFNHHHQHLQTFHQPILNRLLEVVYAFLTGVTTYAWFLHHVVGHHQNYQDQTTDESRWRRDDGTKMGAAEYTVITAGTGYPRAYQTGGSFPKHRRVFVVMLLVQVSLLALLFHGNWFNTLCLFLFPMLAGLLITSWHTYYHHAGLESDDHFESSYNIVHRSYNWWTGNLGYHTAHHLRGGLHWSQLPAFHQEIAADIPPHLYRQPCFPFRWMAEN